MKRSLSTILIFTCVLQVFSQDVFQKGHIYSVDNETIACFIKNTDWGRSPLSIKYKIAEEGEVMSASPSEISGFKVEDYKFITATVQVDRSSDDLNSLNSDRAPDFETRKVFLKVLVEGRSNLYVYDDNIRRRYFYSSNGKEYEALVYKKYRVGQREIMENKTFHQQLYNDINCNITPDEVKQVLYNEASLMSYFVRMNKCFRVEPVVYQRKSSSNKFHLIPKAGAGLVFGDLVFLNRKSSSYSTELKGTKHFSFSSDLEFKLPMERDRFSLIITPGYQQFSYEENSGEDSLVFDSRFATFGIGARYSIYSGSIARWFASLQYIQYIPVNAQYVYLNEDYLSDESLAVFEMKGSPGLYVGIGHAFQNRIFIQTKIEMRFETKDTYIVSNPVYTSVFLELGYILF